MRGLQRAAGQATSIPVLYGIEGEAAARCFEEFQTMLSSRVLLEEGIGFSGRNRLPAQDPVNAALNYCYGLLLADSSAR